MMRLGLGKEGILRMDFGKGEPVIGKATIPRS